MTIKKIKVWDRFVRIHHWSLVLLFITLYLSGIYGWPLTHEIAGYLMFLALLMRIIWGFTGTKHARFKNFLHSPKKIMRFVSQHFTKGHQNASLYAGHNPAGGAMIVLLLTTLIMALLTGLATLATIDFWGPLWPFLHSISNDVAQLFRLSHYWLSDVLILLIGLHLVGVVFSSLKDRINLVKAMITGYKYIQKTKVTKESAQ